MKQIINGERLHLGVCYYPEHWPESMWREDLKRMLAVGIEVVRIAEFAWSKIEPREGEFTYEFFDRFLDVAEEENMKVIFCTPTATPPAWLTHKYPEVLNAYIDGTLYRHGARRHYNYNSPVYQEMSDRITEKSAARYAKRKCVIGWQLDNELNCETADFYSESDSIAFRKFLQEKYGDLETLNDAWGTDFWNQGYTDWEEVFVPQPTISDSTNPHRVLDYKRFVSTSTRAFAKSQADILKKYIKPGDFITTNGLFGHVDNHAMTEESLDFMTYDSYPNFAYSLDMYNENADDLRDRKWSRNLSETRSISPQFGIMEQQSGANGWNTRLEAPTPRPGQMTLWTMQSIAHGADFVSYFRWRTCTMGTEIYWHGILDYSSRENRRIREVGEIHKKLKNMAGVAGSVYEAKVAVLKDYDNVWDAELDRWHERVERVSQKSLFNAAQLTHTPMDYVYLTDSLTATDLAKYDVVFYPHATMMSDERAALLEAYVAAGGQLVVACRSAYKDMTGKCVMDKLPAQLAKVTGADIPEYSFISPETGQVKVDWDGTTIEATVFADLLQAEGEGAKLEATYTEEYYAGSGALVSNTFGKGKAWYYGSAFTEDAARVFLDKLGVSSPYADLISLPESVELAVRVKDGVKYLFVLNYDHVVNKIELKQAGTNLYTGEEITGEVQLEAYETLVIQV